MNILDFTFNLWVLFVNSTYFNFFFIPIFCLGMLIICFKIIWYIVGYSFR